MKNKRIEQVLFDYKGKKMLYFFDRYSENGIDIISIEKINNQFYYWSFSLVGNFTNEQIFKDVCNGEYTNYGYSSDYIEELEEYIPNIVEIVEKNKDILFDLELDDK